MIIVSFVLGAYQEDARATPTGQKSQQELDMGLAEANLRLHSMSGVEVNLSQDYLAEKHKIRFGLSSLYRSLHCRPWSSPSA